MKIATSGAMTRMVLATARTDAVWFANQRQRRFALLDFGWVVAMSSALARPCRCPARHGPDQQPRTSVHHDRDQKQRQPNLNQCAPMHVADCFVDLVGDHGC